MPVTTPAPRAYTLPAESVLYNGARDTEGGIWIRIRDEDDRRIGAAAIEKQLKNQQAATGTLTALDPSAGHLIDYVQAALERIKSGFVGARPAAAQLDGTPIGEAMKEGARRVNGAAGADSNTTGGSTGPKTRAKRGRGGDPKPVGEIVAGVATSAQGAAGTAGADAVQWSDTVPKPRPKTGDLVRLPEGHASSITTPIGYDTVTGAFRVVDADGWDGFVTVSPVLGEWRVMDRLLDYSDDEPAAPAPAADAIDGLTNGVNLDDDAAAERAAADAAHAAAEAGEGETLNAGEIVGEQGTETSQNGTSANASESTSSTASETASDSASTSATAPAAPAEPAAKPSSQRERNARANGLRRAESGAAVKGPAKKTAAKTPSKPAAKTPSKPTAKSGAKKRQ